MRYAILIFSLLQLSTTLEGKRDAKQPKVRTKKLRSGVRPREETAAANVEQTSIEQKGPKLQKEPRIHHLCSVLGTSTDGSWKHDDCEDSKQHSKTPDTVVKDDDTSDLKVEKPGKSTTSGVFHFAVDDTTSSGDNRDSVWHYGSSYKAKTHEKESTHHFDILWKPSGQQHQKHSSFQNSETGKGKGGRKHKKYKGKGGKGKGEKGKGEKGKGKKKEKYSEYYYVTLHPTMQPVTGAPSAHPTTQIITERPVIVDPPPRKPDLRPSVAPTPGRLNDPGVRMCSCYFFKLTRIVPGDSVASEQVYSFSVSCVNKRTES